MKNIKNYLKGDKYANSKLSRAIEEGKIDKVRDIWPMEQQLSNAEVLQKVACDIAKPEVRGEYDINQEVALRIYAGAVDQLNLMGEDTAAVVDCYDSLIKDCYE